MHRYLVSAVLAAGLSAAVTPTTAANPATFDLFTVQREATLLSIDMAGTVTARQTVQLSAQIAGDGDEQATLRRIAAIWAVAEPDVEATRRDLAGGIQTTVDMARNAVVRVRPADADKAFSILTDLVDRYTGDG